jgi:hypothetical protein
MRRAQIPLKLVDFDPLSWGERVELMGLLRWRALQGVSAAIGIGALSVLLAGCGENLDGSSGCPLVCNDVSSQIQTVTLDAITVDTTVPADLGLGTESLMLLSSRGDTLDTRVIIRFDSLPLEAVHSTSSSTLVLIDSVNTALLHLRFDSLAATATVPVTVSAYELDTSATPDTAVATLAPLFVPAHFIGAKTFAPGTLADTVSIPISDTLVLAKIKARTPLRIGLRISANKSVSAHVYATESGLPPALTFRVSADTTVPVVGLTPYSATPAEDKIVSGNQSDFTLIVIGTTTPSASFLAIGGLPASRTYLRFNIPLRLIDSSNVVRATLLLTQALSTSPDQTDSMLVQPNIGVAGATITDVGRAAQIISATLVTMEPLVTFPPSTGLKEIEVAPVFVAWALQQPSVFPRALVLRGGQEAIAPQQVLFYSSRAADPSVRPKLRISYTLRARIGTP